MKRVLLAIAMVLALGMDAQAAAQTHRHTPRTEQADTTKQQEAVEAYSDTTTVADHYQSSSVTYTDEEASRIVKEAFSEAFAEVDSKDVAGVLMVIFIGLAVLFLPLIILVGIIVYFVNKNRRERIRLAQMAMQNGQPIPDDLLRGQTQPATGKDEYATGMRQLFLGVGLMFFLGYTAGKFGFGIGALVFFIGLGKVIIAKTSKNNIGSEPNDNMRDFNDN